MTTPRKVRLRQVDNQLSTLQVRLNYLHRDRDELEAASLRKRKPETREHILAQIAKLDAKIEAAQKEEWDADNERYDLIWNRR